MARRGSRVLYHIGKRPGSPKPASGAPWPRPKQRKEPFSTAIFMSDNPYTIAVSHGVRGNVYAYRVPEWVIRKAGGLQRYDRGTEIVIPQSLWNEAGDEIEFLGKKWNAAELIDRVKTASWRGYEAGPRRGSLSKSGFTGRDVMNLVRSERRDEAIKLMTPDEIRRSIENLEELISSAKSWYSLGPQYGVRYDVSPRGVKETIADLKRALGENVLRIAIRTILEARYGWGRPKPTSGYKRAVAARATEFEDWLSPDVVTLLINKYAEEHQLLGKLKWSYKRLPGREWGRYVPGVRNLYVNDAKTKGLFKQQVNTILHEIQHWNQHCDIADMMAINDEVNLDAFEGPDNEFIEDRWGHKVKRSTVKDQELRRIAQTNNNLYDRSMGTGFTRHERYLNNKFEVDAREFADAYLEEAMAEIGKHYGGKIEGGQLDDVIEELIDEYDPDGPPLTRFQIGTALKDWDLNTPENMKEILSQLKDLGVKVA